jgi:ankyrin repeat protein
LISAALRGHDRIVTLLLAAGADPNYANAAGGTALMAAASRGLVDICRSLVLAGAKTNLKDAAGRTAADWALQDGHDALAEELRTLT